MRRIITGTRDGKSCVISEIDCGAKGPGISGKDNFTEISINPPPPPRPPGHGAFLDLHVPVGALRWMTVVYPPNGEYRAMHHTDTIDCNTVIAGSIDLILDDGRHSLSPGDCVMVNGVDHAWQAGEEGCTMSFLFIGTPAP